MTTAAMPARSDKKAPVSRCFFVLLFAMSNVDAEKFQQVVASLQSSFSILPAGGATIGDGQMVGSGISQLKELDGLQERKEQIVERMKLIQDLQGVRPVIVHVFDELAKLTPSNMYVTEFSRKENKFTLKGKAQDPNVVSDFLRNLDASPWFRNAFMNSFEAVEAKPVQQGSVLPREEDAYGVFDVTVDLDDYSTVSTDTMPEEMKVSP